MSIETLGTLGAFENKENIESVMDSIKDLHKKREDLQKRGSKIFYEIIGLDLKYPLNVQSNEQKKFKSDRSFYTPEDLDTYHKLKPEQDKIDAEKEELDREILRRRFEAGLDCLQALNAKNSPWKLVEKHLPNREKPKSEMDFLHTEKWRCVADDIEANLEFSADVGQSFFTGMKKVAEQTGDTKLAENLAKWPAERQILHSNPHVHFSVGPKTLLRSNKDLWPGLSLTKYYGLSEEEDRVDIGFPSFADGHTFPKIDEIKKEQAKLEMLKLLQKVDIAI